MNPRSRWPRCTGKVKVTQNSGSAQDASSTITVGIMEPLRAIATDALEPPFTDLVVWWNADSKNLGVDGVFVAERGFGGGDAVLQQVRLRPVDHRFIERDRNPLDLIGDALNGHPVVRFGGTDLGLLTDTAQSFTTSRTLYFVYRFRSLLGEYAMRLRGSGDFPLRDVSSPTAINHRDGLNSFEDTSNLTSWRRDVLVVNVATNYVDRTAKDRCPTSKGTSVGLPPVYGACPGVGGHGLHVGRGAPLTLRRNGLISCRSLHLQQWTNTSHAGSWPTVSGSRTTPRTSPLGTLTRPAGTRPSGCGADSRRASGSVRPRDGTLHRTNQCRTSLGKPPRNANHTTSICRGA